jgi:hypothetical protein
VSDSEIDEAVALIATSLAEHMAAS